ncbi:MAG: bifunctional DNA-formamidopyrimidine glycosylase/DNA-(apurinic or apyrimidinic site) lyase [bacterium]
MPELPEVETIRRQLEKEIKGATIKEVEVRNAKPLNVPPEKFISAVSGAKIKEVGRRAKLLLLYLTNGNILMFHLKMTGRMLLVKKGAEPTKHTHIVFKLSPHRLPTLPRGESERGVDLFFEDYRRFGFVKLLEEKNLEKYFAGEGYGPEPLSPQFSYKIMKARLLAHKNKKIKQMLMEQSCVAGIGNIYAAEICFYAGVHPERKVGEIKETEFKKIYDGTKKILKAAIANRGSSADAYLDAYGKQGTFVPKLKVYDREGKKCVRCGGIIKKIKSAGRGTYFCPKCQK